VVDLYTVVMRVVDIGVIVVRVIESGVVGLVVGAMDEDCLKEVEVVDKDYLMKVEVVAEGCLMDDPTRFDAYHWLYFNHQA